MDTPENRFYRLAGALGLGRDYTDFADRVRAELGIALPIAAPENVAEDRWGPAVVATDPRAQG